MGSDHPQPPLVWHLARTRVDRLGPAWPVSGEFAMVSFPWLMAAAAASTEAPAEQSWRDFSFSVFSAALQLLHFGWLNKFFWENALSQIEM